MNYTQDAEYLSSLLACSIIESYADRFDLQLVIAYEQNPKSGKMEYKVCHPIADFDFFIGQTVEEAIAAIDYNYLDYQYQYEPD